MFSSNMWAMPTAVTIWSRWLEFREVMLAHYVNDLATWVNDPNQPPSARLGANRWYSHQIPADYLDGRLPGVSPPADRLLASASPLWTSVVDEDVLEPHRLAPLPRRLPLVITREQRLPRVASLDPQPE